MNVIVAGGTGFIGKALVTKLLQQGHSVTVLTRAPQKVTSWTGTLRGERWNAETLGEWAKVVEGADGVINLTGELIAGKRWTKRQKRLILDSRVKSTRALVSAIERTRRRPSVFINVSAVGYYGDVPQGEVTELSSPGSDFLAGVCAQWEAEEFKAEKCGVRVVTPRLGVILAGDGGALPRLTMPFKFFAGGYLGTGRQWFPWIHIDDVVNAFLFLMENSTIVGPVNIAAPDPLTMKEFTKVLGRTLHRPAWTVVPSLVLRLALGEMAEMLLTGQRVIPQKLLDKRFRFQFATAQAALSDIFERGK